MYVKQYDENGLVTNPITKERPFFNRGENRKSRRFYQRKSTNRKGPGCVVTKIGTFTFTKYRTVKQHLNGRLIIHSILR
jgi:hypothetical protein